MDWTVIAAGLIQLAIFSGGFYYLYFHKKSKFYKKPWVLRLCVVGMVITIGQYSFEYWRNMIKSEAAKVERLEKLQNSVAQQGTLATSDVVFESPDGYRILIPSGYTYSKPTVAHVSLVAIKNFDTSHTPGLSVMVASSNATNEEFSDQARKAMQKENSTTKFIDPVRFKNGLTEINRVEMTSVREKGNLMSIMLFASNAGKNYTVIIGTRAELFSASKPEFERIVSSFSLSKQEEKPVATRPGRTEQPQPVNAPTSVEASPLQVSMSAYVRDAAGLVPYVLNGEQQVTAVSQSGKQMVHQVRMSKSRASDLVGTDLLREARHALAAQNCKQADIRWAFGQGAVFRYEFKSADGVAIGVVDISKRSCAA